MNPIKETIVQWQGGMAFNLVTQSGHSVLADSSIEHGGGGQGPQPTDLVLMALGSCTAMDVLSILQKKRQSVTAFQVQVIGTRREEHPRVFTEIALHYQLTGSKIDPTAVARAIELSVTKYCPVYAMLSASVNITTAYTISEAGVP